jgi:hypothetical protein
LRYQEWQQLWRNNAPMALESRILQWYGWSIYVQI